AARRLLHDRRARHRRRAVLGRALPRGQHRHDRGAADLGDVARMAGKGGGPARATAEAVARRSYGKLVAYLAARTRDVAGAEDALSDAFAAALADWPASGVPDSPEAWLMMVARRRLIDAARRRHSRSEAAADLRLLGEELAEAAAGDAP